MNCDIYNTETGEIYFNFKLINTPASHIWSHAVYQNQLVGRKLTGIRDNNSINISFKNDDIRKKHQEEAVARINSNIKIVNEGLIGKVFPYEAYVGMDQEHCIKIHRAFTNGITSTVGWFHEGTEKQKFWFKKEHAFGPHKREKIRSATPPTFVLKDPFRKGNRWDNAMEEINQGVHDYESTIEISRKLDSETFTFNFGKEFSTYMNVNEYNESIKPKHKRDNPEVFLFSCIHGRDYIETYRIEDDPTEFDVVNIENIASEFRVILNPENLYNLNSMSSPNFQKWALSHNININYAMPIPLGKLNCEVKEDRLLDICMKAIQTPGIIDLRFNMP